MPEMASDDFWLKFDESAKVSPPPADGNLAERAGKAGFEFDLETESVIVHRETISVNLRRRRGDRLPVDDGRGVRARGVADRIEGAAGKR